MIYLVNTTNEYDILYANSNIYTDFLFKTIFLMIYLFKTTNYKWKIDWKWNKRYLTVYGCAHKSQSQSQPRLCRGEHGIEEKKQTDGSESCKSKK